MPLIRWMICVLVYADYDKNYVSAHKAGLWIQVGLTRMRIRFSRKNRIRMRTYIKTRIRLLPIF